MRTVLRSLAIAALAAVFLSPAPVSAARSFSDVGGHWAEQSIYEAAGRGVIDGRPDGTFGPNELISRAAFIKMMVTAAGVASRSGDPSFQDTETHWAHRTGHIEGAVRAGLLVPSEYGSRLEPDRAISREEMAVLAVRAVRDEPPPGGVGEFSDWGAVTGFRKPYVAEARQLGLLSGRPDGSFGPLDPATRADAAVVAIRVLNARTPRRVVDQEGLAKAQAALARGVTLEDRTGDWFSTGHVGDNPGIHPLDCADFRTLGLGMDDDYLYVRFGLGGRIPARPADFPVVDGDQVMGLSFNVALDVDNDPTTGCRADGGAEAFLSAGFVRGDEQSWDTRFYSVGPTGIDDPEEKRYRETVFQRGGEYLLMWGGLGEDWFITAYPLDKLGLRPGQTIIVSAWAEAGSGKYHHATFEVLDTPSWSLANRFHSRVEITLPGS